MWVENVTYFLLLSIWVEICRHSKKDRFDSKFVANDLFFICDKRDFAHLFKVSGIIFYISWLKIDSKIFFCFCFQYIVNIVRTMELFLCIFAPVDKTFPSSHSSALIRSTLKKGGKLHQNGKRKMVINIAIGTIRFCRGHLYYYIIFYKYFMYFYILCIFMYLYVQNKNSFHSFNKLLIISSIH